MKFIYIHYYLCFLYNINVHHIIFKIKNLYNIDLFLIIIKL